MQTQEVADKAAALMPELMQDLEKLVAIPSIAFPGYPSEPVMEMAEQTLAKFRDVGFTNARLMEVPSGYPPIYGEIPGPEGSPVVMLYAHYDVQPAPPEQGWTTDPWTPTTEGRADVRPRSRRRQGRVGDSPRHHADPRGQAAVHGQADRGGNGGDQQATWNPSSRRIPSSSTCDLFIVCDMGNLRVDEPVLTTSPPRRRRLHRHRPHPRTPAPLGPVRWGAPDAMMALARLLSTLVDDEGNVAVADVTTGTGRARSSRGGPAIQRRHPRGCLHRGFRSHRGATVGEGRRSTRSGWT